VVSDTRWFTVDEARSLMPELRALADELIAERATLTEATAGGVLADRKASEARLSEILDRIAAIGVQIKGWAPLLVDFPHRHGDRVLLLCWLEGEEQLDWYHDAAHGFAGRRRIADLADLADGT
jgi:hypothetical protein